MDSAAPIVFVGAAFPVGVDAANRLPQAEPSPDVPPEELTQIESMLASALISATGRVAPAGSKGPGAVPEPTDATSAAEAKALASPVEFLALVDMLAVEEAKGASGHAA